MIHSKVCFCNASMRTLFSIVFITNIRSLKLQIDYSTHLEFVTENSNYKNKVRYDYLIELLTGSYLLFSVIVG
jgi:hypothetical protein